MIPNFGPGSATEDDAVSRLGARSIHLALAAARDAWADSQLDRAAEVDADRVAVVIGSAFGGMDLHEAEAIKSAKRKSLSTSPYLVPGLLINQAAGQVAQHLGLHGPSVAPANACATGGHAIALAAMFLRAGEADFAVCGGAESAFTPLIVNGFATMKALVGRRAEDRSVADPAQASRPFSVDRAGFVMSEGAGTVDPGDRGSAVEKFGLDPQAELAGWALNSDGYHMAMPNGAKIEKCLATALNRAGLRPGRYRLLQRARDQHPGQRPSGDAVDQERVLVITPEACRSVPSRGRSAMAWAPRRRSRRRFASGLCKPRSSRRRSTTAPTPNSTSTTSPTTRERPPSARSSAPRLGLAVRTTP